MWKKVKELFFGFIQKQEDISDHYMTLIIFLFTLFIFTQIISSIFFFINLANLILTILTGAFLVTLLVLLRIPKYRLTIKIAFLIISHLLVLFFWVTSEGLTGSIVTIMPIIIFIVISILPQSQIFIPLVLSYAFFICIILFESYFPEYIIPYESVSSKKFDIITGMFLSASLVGFSFMYLRKLYQEKTLALKNQVTLQKQLNEELDNFVYRTSHDLRSPVSSSLGLISLLKDTHNPEEIALYLDLQEKSLRRMDAFISEILNYSRNSRMDVTLEKIDFRAVFENSVEQNKFSQPELSTFSCAIDVSQDLTFYSDKLRLSIIFNNMVSNSFRYHNPKSPNPFLRVRVEAKNNTIQIIFQDNGLGIAPASLPRVFEMFYRGHKTSTGSGVGLYIVKQSIEKLGGTIECSSIVNEGTTFTVTLPNLKPS